MRMAFFRSCRRPRMEVGSESSAPHSGIRFLCGGHTCLAALEHCCTYCSLNACLRLHSPSLQEQRQKKGAEFQSAGGEEKLSCTSSWNRKSLGLSVGRWYWELEAAKYAPGKVCKTGVLQDSPWSGEIIKQKTLQSMRKLFREELLMAHSHVSVTVSLL